MIWAMRGPLRHVLFQKAASRPILTRVASRCLATRSPTVHRKEREARKAQQPRPDVSKSKYPWPTAVIDRAFRDNVIPFNTLKATDVLGDFAALRQAGGLKRQGLTALLEEHKIEPVHLSMLAHILLQTDIKALYPIAKSIFLSASELGDEFATVTLIEQALRHSRREDLKKPELRVARVQLEKMAQSDNAGAKVLQARVLDLEGGDVEKTLDLLEEAVVQGRRKDDESVNKEEQRDAKGPDPSLGVVWMAIARAQEKLGQQNAAKKAIENAALAHDNPQAYYQLAERSDPASAEYIEYMLKAAASGVGNAAYKVGLWNLHELERATTRPSAGGTGGRRSPYAPVAGVVSWYPLIRQWFAVALEAAECDHRPTARMHVVRILFRERDVEGARLWLRGLAQDQSVPKAVTNWLQNLWKSGDPDALTSTDFEARIKGLSQRAA